MCFEQINLIWFDLISLAPTIITTLSRWALMPNSHRPPDTARQSYQYLCRVWRCSLNWTIAINVFMFQIFCMGQSWVFGNPIHTAEADSTQTRQFCRVWRKKVKVAHTRLFVGFRSWSRFLAVSLQVTWVINPAVGCHYFPPAATLKRAATSFAARWTEAWSVWAVCLRLLPDSVTASIWTRALQRLSPVR